MIQGRMCRLAVERLFIKSIENMIIKSRVQLLKGQSGVFKNKDGQGVDWRNVRLLLGSDVFKCSVKDESLWLKLRELESVVGDAEIDLSASKEVPRLSLVSFVLVE